MARMYIEVPEAADQWVAEIGVLVHATYAND